jgi:hypothetical protein
LNGGEESLRGEEDRGKEEEIMLEPGKKRILIIEDDVEMRSLLREFLNDER